MYCTCNVLNCAGSVLYCTGIQYCAVWAMYWFRMQTYPYFGCHSNQRMSKIELSDTIPCCTWPRDKNMRFWLKSDKVDFWVPKPSKLHFSLLPSNQKNHYSSQKNLHSWTSHHRLSNQPKIKKWSMENVSMKINASSRGWPFAGNWRGIGLSSTCFKQSPALCNWSQLKPSYFSVVESESKTTSRR